jgi:hypothetical protein
MVETGPTGGVAGGVRGLLGERGAKGLGERGVKRLAGVAVDEGVAVAEGVAEGVAVAEATAEESPIHGKAPEATAEDKVVDVTLVGAVGAMVAAVVASLAEATAAGEEPNPIVTATQRAGMSPMPWGDLDDARDDACSGGMSDGVMRVAAAAAVKAAASGVAGPASSAGPSSSSATLAAALSASVGAALAAATCAPVERSTNGFGRPAEGGGGSPNPEKTSRHAERRVASRSAWLGSASGPSLIVCPRPALTATASDAYMYSELDRMWDGAPPSLAALAALAVLGALGALGALAAPPPPAAPRSAPTETAERPEKPRLVRTGGSGAISMAGGGGLEISCSCGRVPRGRGRQSPPEL